MFAKKVLTEINGLCLFGQRHFVQVEARDGEHFACPFAIAGADDGRMHPQKAPLLEELMDRR